MGASCLCLRVLGRASAGHLEITHRDGEGVPGPTWNPLVLHRTSFVMEEEELLLKWVLLVGVVMLSGLNPALDKVSVPQFTYL